MSGQLQYVAVWPKVGIWIGDKRVIVTRGQPVPKGAEQDSLRLLATVGALTIHDPDAAGDQSVAGPPAGPPIKSAPKGEWVIYAISQGMDPAEATAANKGALWDQYGADASSSTPPADPPAEELHGAALDEALEQAGLSKSGTVAEKQARLAEYEAEQS